MRGIENLQILRSQESLVLIQTHSALPLPPPLQKLFIIQLSCLFFSRAFYLITSSAGWSGDPHVSEHVELTGVPQGIAAVVYARVVDVCEESDRRYFNQFQPKIGVNTSQTILMIRFLRWSTPFSVYSYLVLLMYSAGFVYIDSLSTTRDYPYIWIWGTYNG